MIHYPQPDTMKVNSDDTGLGYMIVNKSDFNPAIHVAWPDRPPVDVAAVGAPKNTVALPPPPTDVRRSRSSAPT